MLLGFTAYAQQVEVVGLLPEKVIINEPYLRFDPFVINSDILKKAYSKEMRVQDHQGYLWFVADNQSLIRYDGHYAKTYDSTRYYGVNMTSNRVVWSLTDAGMAIFDTMTEKFNTYPTPLIKNYVLWGETSSAQGKIYILFPTTSNNIRAPFFEFDTKTNRFKHIKLPPIINGYTHQYEPDTAALVLLRPLAVDALGRVWGQVSHASDTNHGRSSLGYYDPVRHQLVWYNLAENYDPEVRGRRKQHQELSINSIVLEDNDRYIWLGGWFHLGLLRFDTHMLRWKQYYFPALKSNQLFVLQPFQKDKFIFHTDDGIKVFDKQTETLHEYPHVPDDQFSPPSNTNSFFLGRRNTVWMGKHMAIGDAAVSYLSPDVQLLRAVPQKIRKERFKIFCQHQNQLYFTYQKPEGFVLASYNEQNGQLTELLKQPDPSKPEQHFNMAFADSLHQVIWFVGKIDGGSIWQWDLRRKRMIKVQETIQNSPLRTDQLYDMMSIAQDKDGNVWLPITQTTATTEGSLVKYDARRKTFVNIVSIQPLVEKQRLRSVMVDSRGIVWLGSWDDNLIRWFDPTTNKLTIKDDINKTTVETNVPITRMVEDIKRGVIWIAATGHGLWKYTPRTNKWQRMPLDKNDVIVNIIITNDGTLWLKSDNALIRYNPETGTAKYLGAEYDLNQFLNGSFIKGKSDELFFGRFRFYPHEIKDVTLKPSVVFSFIKVFNHDLVLPQNLNSVTQITLRHDQSFFTVGFSALSYIQHQKNQYAYRLLRFSNEWVLCGNNPLAAFTNVPPGEYELQIKGSNYDGVWSEVRSLKIIITPPFWQTWWFRGLMLALGLVVIYTMYRYRLEQQTLKSRLTAEEALRKQREAEYQQRIAQTEISALRAQMNPHFIFNCLNSIQYFTASNEADTASEYLSKFSRLIRLVLENSRSEKVTLTNELETLRLYIEMEAMRFQQKVRYEINVSDEVDTDTIQIPPLLVQPFVENAIWHGLMHKETGGLVTIAVKQPSEGLLRIEVIDDGVGRLKATELKSKSVIKHKSFGMKVTTERIELINQLYQTNTSVKINDLKDDWGRAVGTEVVVEIPI
jgi:streptogramin lyase/signal transduction histidine kinase